MKPWHQMTHDERKLASEQAERDLNAMRDAMADKRERFFNQPAWESLGADTSKE
jgi:hypothetical protein